MDEVKLRQELKQLRAVAEISYDLLRPWRVYPEDEGVYLITEYSCERLQRALVKAGYPAKNT